ncbi:MAG: hypothetical protein AAGF60_04615 [Pseudomonadota bacterium]
MTQPDVSAFTILEMIRQLGHDPALMDGALGSVYDRVVLLSDAPYTRDLWREGQPYATLICAGAACTFDYWDFGARVDAFSVQATMWAEAHVGPVMGEWPERMARSADWTLSLRRAARGPESEIILRLERHAP